MAADIAIAGMNPMEFLRSTDPVEVSVMVAIANRYMKRREELDDRLAHMIINTLSKAIK